MNLHPSSVRGCIRSFLQQHAHQLAGPVLEVGSRRGSEAAAWANNRTLRPELDWLGVDMQPGCGVDQVVNMESGPLPWLAGSFGGAVCSEVLEHVYRPLDLLRNIRSSLRRDAKLLVTTLFAFPEHGFPQDFWRFTTTCLGRLLEDAGFLPLLVSYAGEVAIELSHIGGPPEARRLPRHVFALAVAR